MDTLWQDVRYAARTLWGRLGITAAATVALGLGIGANTAVFTLVNAVLLRPLPVPESDRVFTVYRVEKEMKFGAASVSRYVDWRDRNDVFEGLGAFAPASFTLTGSGEPTQLSGATGTASLFRVLGAAPRLGRWFTDEEDRPGGPATVVLGYALWRDRFGADPGIVGRRITLDGNARTVVGVAGADFIMPWAQVWAPLARAADEATRGNNFLRPIGRLKPGISMDAAVQRLNLLADTLNRERGDAYGFRLQPVREWLLGSIDRPLLLLMVTVTCVLLIACANVANLLLARAIARRRELAVRAALGASRARIVRQLLTENVLLALVGGAFGIFLASGLVRLFLAIAPGNTIPRANTVALDSTVLIFTLAISTFVGLLFGLAPALQFVRTDILGALREGGSKSGTASRGATFATRALVVAEIALTLVLLIGASLLVKSLIRLQTQDLGLRPESVTTFAVSLSAPRYNGVRGQTVVRQFVNDVLERLRHTPGVRAAGGINMLPLVSTGFNGGIRIEGQPAPQPGQEQVVEYRTVTPGYFEAMGIALRAGRLFDERDTPTSAPVAIINEAMAKRFWPHGDAVGRRVQPQGDSTWYDVVGVVASARTRQLDVAEESELYGPLAQNVTTRMTFAVRTDPGAPVMNAIRQQLAQIDPQQPLSNVKTMEQVVTEATGGWRLSSVLTTLFAIVAAVLAAIGVYSVMAYSVAQRTREIGIRMALGADAARVRGQVLRDGLGLGVIGVLLGLGISIVAMRLLASQLYEVSPRDPVVYAATVVGVMVCAALACWVPARRATRVNPMVALQAE
jgi:putative ABC transport system permease protein